jgi:hypothetical protein
MNFREFLFYELRLIRERRRAEAALDPLRLRSSTSSPGGAGRSRYGRLPQDGAPSSVLLLVSWKGFPPVTFMV